MKNISGRFTKLVISALLCTAIIPTVAFAKTYFNVNVYGNRYTVAAEGTKDDQSNFITVTVTDIYKADGSASDYKKVKADVLDNSGNQISNSTDNVLDLDEAELVMLRQVYASGTRIKLRMKGNTSSLDCKVTFTAPIS